MHVDILRVAGRDLSCLQPYYSAQKYAHDWFFSGIELTSHERSWFQRAMLSLNSAHLQQMHPAPYRLSYQDRSEILILCSELIFLGVSYSILSMYYEAHMYSKVLDYDHSLTLKVPDTLRPTACLGSCRRLPKSP